MQRKLDTDNRQQRSVRKRLRGKRRRSESASRETKADSAAQHAETISERDQARALNAELEAKLTEEAKQKREHGSSQCRTCCPIARGKQKGNLEAQNADLVVGLAEQTA
jgi:hypothetical protein